VGDLATADRQPLRAMAEIGNTAAGGSSRNPRTCQKKSATPKNLQTSQAISKHLRKSRNVSEADRATARNRKTQVKRPEYSKKIQKHETRGS